MDGNDARSSRGHFIGRIDGLVHHLKDRGASLLSLLESTGEHVGRDPVELGVQLQRSDELASTGHLKVHVAEGVLSTEDVGESPVLGLAVLVSLAHEAHGDSSD